MLLCTHLKNFSTSFPQNLWKTSCPIFQLHILLFFSQSRVPFFSILQPFATNSLWTIAGFVGVEDLEEVQREIFPARIQSDVPNHRRAIFSFPFPVRQSCEFFRPCGLPVLLLRGSVTRGMRGEKRGIEPGSSRTLPASRDPEKESGVKCVSSPRILVPKAGKAYPRNSKKGQYPQGKSHSVQRKPSQPATHRALSGEKKFPESRFGK